MGPSRGPTLGGVALVAVVLGGCGSAHVRATESESPKPAPKPESSVTAPTPRPSPQIATLVAEAWAKRDERLFAAAFEQVGNAGKDGFREDTMRLSADGRTVLVNAQRGTALLDASTGEPRTWLAADATDEFSLGWFVDGRPDELLFFRGSANESEGFVGECIVVSVDTGAERFRLPRCRIPFRWHPDDGGLGLAPPWLVRAGAGECGDDELVSWAAGATPIPLAAVSRKTPRLSYPWGRCLGQPDPEKEQQLLPEFRSATGVGVRELSAHSHGTLAVVFAGPAMTTVGLRGANGHWLSFVRGEFAFGRYPVLPAISPDGRWVAVKSAARGNIDSESHVLVLDAASGAVRHDFGGPCKFAKSLTWSSDSKLLAVGDQEASCMFEVGKGLLWTRTFVKPDDCFRCQKIPEFVMGDRVVVVTTILQMPGGAALETRSGRVLAAAAQLGPVEERAGELRVVVGAGTEKAALAIIDSKLKARSQPISAAELETMYDALRENPVALKFRNTLCTRDGFIFPTRYCR